MSRLPNASAKIVASGCSRDCRDWRVSHNGLLSHCGGYKEE